MALAPEPYLSGCLRVLYIASLEARMIGYSGSASGLSAEESQRLADLADAVHNLPDLMQHWERVNEPLLRGMLEHYDDRWGTKSSMRLLVAYDDVLGAV